MSAVGEFVDDIGTMMVNTDLDNDIVVVKLNFLC